MAPISEIASHEMIMNAAITVGAKKIVLSDCGTNVPELQTTELLSEVHRGESEMKKYMESKEGRADVDGLGSRCILRPANSKPSPFFPKPFAIFAPMP